MLLEEMSFIKAPDIDNTYDFYITGSNNEKLNAYFGKNANNKKIKLNLYSSTNEEINFKLAYEGNIPSNIIIMLIDESGKQITDKRWN